MGDVRKDIVHTKDVISDVYHYRYSKVYFNSNENLRLLFDNFDVKDKTCLSILSSGDQALHLLNKNIKKIDLFDKNKLTIYYFFLRTWVIKYLDEFYPPNNISISFIRELLEFVNLSDENELIAYKYWNEFINTFNDTDLNNLFKRDLSINNVIKDLDFIKKKLNGNYEFYNLDILEKIDINKKYDFIYLSNIIEWVIRNKDDISVLRDNLYNLLNDNGFVICSNVCKSGISGLGSLLFEKGFDYYKIPCVKIGINTYSSPGYCYKKKK